MKVTGFLVSKKLAEIGFRAECFYFYFHSDNNCKEKTLYNLEEFGFDKIDDCDIEDKYYPAYDLETILDNICFVIENKENKKVYLFRMNQQDMEYITFEQEVDIEFYTPRQKGESLADTAGRMIIKLHEKNLIKF